jgi:hypothetical protein
MQRLRKYSGIVLAISLLCICCGFALKPAKSKPRAQDLQTINIKAEDYPQAFQNKEPVKIIGLYLGDMLIKSGEDVQAGKHWLRDLRVLVKNVSDQSIRQVILELDLPTNESGSEGMRLKMHFGRDYFYSQTPDAKVPDVLVRPGEMATVSYNRNDSDLYQRLQDSLKGHHHSIPNKATLFLGAVVFEDTEKGWVAPAYSIRCGLSWCSDPSKPYKRIASRQSRIERAAMLKSLVASGKPPRCLIAVAPGA